MKKFCVDCNKLLNKDSQRAKIKEFHNDSKTFIDESYSFGLLD